MSAEKVLVDAAALQSLNEFKNVKTENEMFLVLGYEQNSKNQLTIIETGNGFIEQAKQYCKDDTVVYILLRKQHQVELAKTTKFVYIDWTPRAIPPLRKALLSTHKGQIRDLMNPVHVSFEWSDQNEIDTQIVLQKIGMASGTLNNVTEKKAIQYANVDMSRSTDKAAKELVPTSVTANRALNIRNEAQLKEAIQAVRNDNEPTNWVHVTYVDNNTLQLAGSGAGGIEQLINELNDTDVHYAFFRTTETIDKTIAVRFCFLKLTPSSLPPLRKATISTHLGFVTDLFNPIHTNFDIGSVHEFNAEIVTERLKSIMGTKNRSHVEEKTIQAETTRTTQPSAVNVVPQSHVPVHSTGSINVCDSLTAAIADVRNDSTPTNWVVATYSGKDTLSLLSSGTGGIEQILDNLQMDNINFALLRVVDKIDKSLTVKFVFIRWQPESVAAMKKSQVSTKKGKYDELFAPYHVDFFITDKSELSPQIVADKVGAASGSKSHLVQK